MHFKLATRRNDAVGWGLRGLMLCLAFVVSLFSYSSAMAEEMLPLISPQKTTYSLPQGIRPQDQIFLISTRNLLRQDCPTVATQLVCKEYANFSCDNDCNKRVWKSTSLERILAQPDKTIPTIIFTHGYQVSEKDAPEWGLHPYRSVIQHAKTAAPVRWIIFSWPSEKIGPILRDIRAKGRTAERTAAHLAWLIDRFDTDTPLAVFGYSYGGRITCGALHLLGGGMLNGKTMEQRIHPNRQLLRTVLLAPAVDNDWLLPGHRYEMAISQMSRLLIVHNHCDPVLKRYHFTQRRRRHRNRPIALGKEGLANIACLGDAAKKIEQLDICCTIGHKHGMLNYLKPTNATERAWKHLSFQSIQKERCVTCDE